MGRSVASKRRLFVVSCIVSCIPSSHGLVTFSGTYSSPSTTSSIVGPSLFRSAVGILQRPSKSCSIERYTLPHTHLMSFPRRSTKSSTQLRLRLPIIGPEDIWGNWAVLSGLAALAQVLGHRTTIGKLLGPPVTAMALSFVAATVGILTPGGTIAAKSLQLFSLQYATPLVLLGADFRDALERCGPLLLSFFAASMSTILACVVGWMVAGPSLQSTLGRDGLAIASALLAKNVGGGINYIAVCRSLNASPTAVAAGLCVDNIFALIYFPMTSVLANGRPDVVLESSTTEERSLDVDQSMTNRSGEDRSVQRISTALFLSTVLLWLGERIGGESGSLPACTVLTVMLVSCAPTTWINSAFQKTANQLGLVALYLFFATAGAPGIAVAESVRISLAPLGCFLSCLYMFHGAFLLVLHHVFGPARFGGAFQAQRLLVSSSAAIGGPATAVALATEANWKSLLVPSLIVGNIGYAVATFLGLVFNKCFL